MKVKTILLFSLLAANLNGLTFAANCNELLVKVQNSTDNNLYIKFSTEPVYQGDSSMNIAPHSISDPIKVEQGTGHLYDNYFQMASSFKPISTLPYNVIEWSQSSHDALDEDVLTYVEIYKYFSPSTTMGGAIQLYDPYIYSSDHRSWIHHSPNTLDVQVSYKNIYRGRCDPDPALAKPGTVTIEVSPVTE